MIILVDIVSYPFLQMLIQIQINKLLCVDASQFCDPLDQLAPVSSIQQLSNTFFKVRQVEILVYNVSWTALHSAHLPQTYDSSFELWAPCVNKDAQHFGAGAAADWKGFCKSVYP